jgi:hypothetical protein
MKIKLLGLVFAGVMMASAAAQAAPVLSQVNGVLTTIGAESDAPFDLNATTGLDAGSSIYLFNSSNTPNFGLQVSDTAKVTYTYLGKEADFTNEFTAPGGSLSTDGSTSVGESFSTTSLADFLNFAINSSDGGSAANNGVITSPVQFAIALLSDTSAIILLDDGGLGIDFDDIAVRVDVSQVPLPPAVWLLISAILGLVSFSRIRRNGAQTA